MKHDFRPFASFPLCVAELPNGDTCNRTKEEHMTDDGRTETQWIGDIAHRTLERLEQIAPELALLQQQFRLMAKWSVENNMGGTGADLYIATVALKSLAEPVQRIIDATERPKQEYHHYGE
jgi:hypothetical protein